MQQPPEELVKSIGCMPGEEPLDVFPRSALAELGYALGLAGFTVLGVASFGLGVAAARTSAPVWEQWFGCAVGTVAALATFGAGWFWWRTHYRSTADLVYLYNDGLIWRTPGGGWAAGRWADAVAVLRRDARDLGPGASQFRVAFAGGRGARCAAQLENYLGLAGQVQRAVHRHLFPILKEQFDAGGTIDFGPVTLTRSELATKPTRWLRAGRYPLVEVREAAIALGGLWLNQRPRGPTTAFFLLNEIPNYTVLIALLPVVPVNWNPAAFE